MLPMALEENKRADTDVPKFSFELRKCNYTTRASPDVFSSFKATSLTKAKGQICPERTSSDTSTPK